MSENTRTTEQDQIRRDTAENAKPKCGICGKYLFALPRCAGHGSSGGGGSGSGGSEEQAGNGPGKDLPKTSNQVDTADDTYRGSTHTSQFQLDDRKFNSEIISELLSMKLLAINNNYETGTLLITLQCDPNLLSTQYRNEFKIFLTAILSELNAFREKNHIGDECRTMKQDKDGNILSLRITLPTPALYMGFIQQLDSKNLLPIQNIQQPKEKVGYEHGVDYFNPTPFSTRPSANKCTRTAEEEEAQMNKQSVFRPKSPLDGLKPKG